MGIATLAIISIARDAVAQQEPRYNQYMDNLLIINPGFAGSKKTGVVLMLARNQWVSFDGAPRTQLFSYQTPIQKYQIGLGFSILTDKIGPLKQTGFYFDYSYFLRVGLKYKLGMGLKGGFSFYKASFTDLQTITPDPIYSADIYKNFLPNFGLGAFVFSDDTYFGISVPKLITNTISRKDYATERVKKEEINIYFVAGTKFKLRENIHLKTYSMLRFVQNAPLLHDLTALVGFKEEVWVGGTFRFGNSYGFLTQFNISKKMLIGYSYDRAFSKLNTFNNGTHEIMFCYNINI